MGSSADAADSGPDVASSHQQTKDATMQLYAIRRRNGWQDGDDLRAAAERSTAEGAKMPDDIRWIRSYVVTEEDGTLGTICIYQASSPEKIREHAARVGMPSDEISVVADTVLVRPDPEPAAAA
jgi:hypothetical protein